MRFMEELHNTEKATSVVRYIDLRTFIDSIVREIR